VRVGGTKKKAHRDSGIDTTKGDANLGAMKVGDKRQALADNDTKIRRQCMEESRAK